jgi:hypothetical protein
MIIDEELAFGINDFKIYATLQGRAKKLSQDLRNFLIEQKSLRKSVVGYGAAAKGITFINFAEIGAELIPLVYDAAKSKQGKYLPGSHIPILDPSGLYKSRPDWIVILPWNIASEVIESFSDLAKSGTRFAVAMPELKTV